MNRETIYAALFSRLQAAGGFQTITRHLQHFADIERSVLPALFQIQKKETAEQSRGLPTKWKLDLDLYIYVQTTDSSASGAVALNPLLDSVEAALAFDPITGTQTLGGTVSHCWINGAIDIYEGVQDTLTVAIIPIEILTNQ